MASGGVAGVGGKGRIVGSSSYYKVGAESAREGGGGGVSTEAPSQTTNTPYEINKLICIYTLNTLIYNGSTMVERIGFLHLAVSKQ